MSSIEITHSHGHSHDDDQDHEHSHDSDSGGKASQEQSEHHGTHTHILVVSTTVAFIAPQNVAFNFDLEIEPKINISAQEKPPADLHLNSIFRPPIQA